VHCFLLFRWLGLLIFVSAIVSCVIALEPKPNIIVVVSDDQGYGELSCHGNPIVKTPYLDRLSRESIRFTNFHVAPMCTPTRGQLMTGCDAIRNGALNVSSGRSLLRADFRTLPELLLQGGYATALFGKWHLGENHPYRPQDRGFEEVVTFPSSHIGSIPDYWLNDYFDDTYLHNGVRRKYQGYTTDVFFNEALQWIRGKHIKKQPFFAYIATAAPHSPHYVPDKYRHAVSQRLATVLPSLPSLDPQTQQSLASYLGMIENFDDNIGRLLDFLDSEKICENTIVVFLTDNGTTFGDQYYPAGMRGKKVTLYEGGHRVPLFIRWPRGNLGESRDESELTQVQDLMPTLLDLVNIAKPDNYPLDGASLAPLMKGVQKTLPDRALFINYSRMPVAANDSGNSDLSSLCEVRLEGAAVLWNDWRLLENKFLYNIKLDPLQTNEVAREHPEIVSELRHRLKIWWEESNAIANSPQSIVIGSDAENPSMLTACDWWNVFVDQQSQVRRGELKRGIWHLEVAKPGEYEIELRRWPREADLPLQSTAPAVQLTDGRLGPGKVIPIEQAELRCAGQVLKLDLKPQAKQATFRIRLNTGPIELEGLFNDADGKTILGAYYAYVAHSPPIK
jgi:arylsulfatase A-like enzyme